MNRKSGEIVSLITAASILLTGCAGVASADAGGAGADGTRTTETERIPVDWRNVVVGYRAFDNSLHLMNVDGRTAATIMLRGVSPANSEVVFDDGAVVKIFYHLLKPGKLSEFPETFYIVDKDGNPLAGGQIDGQTLNERAPKDGGKGLR